MAMIELVIFYIVCWQVELFTLALQGDTCTKNSLNLKNIFAIAFRSRTEDRNVNDADVEDSISSKILYTENELKVIETELNKYLTSDKVSNAMKILRGFQMGATEQELDSSVVGGFKAKSNTDECIINLQWGDIERCRQCLASNTALNLNSSCFFNIHMRFCIFKLYLNQVNLMISAAKTLTNGCPTENSTNNRL